MSCVQVESGFLCYGKGYKFMGFYFEWHNYCGPSPLRKDGEIAKRIPKGFWDMVDKFVKLSDEEKESYKVY